MASVSTNVSHRHVLTSNFDISKSPSILPSANNAKFFFPLPTSIDIDNKVKQKTDNLPLIVTPKTKVIVVESKEQFKLIKEIFGSEISLVANKKWTVCSINPTTTFAFDNDMFKQELNGIFSNINLIKLISKPLNYYQGIYQMSLPSAIHYSVFLSDVRLIPRIKKDLFNVKLELIDQFAEISRILMKYKKLSDDLESKKYRPHFIKNQHFNIERKAYLIYLTLFNEILLEKGQLPPENLIEEIKASYQSLKMDPEIALKGLIELGALIYDHSSKEIMIPDMPPI